MKISDKIKLWGKRQWGQLSGKEPKVYETKGQSLKYLGDEDYGGWWLDVSLIKKGDIVYSFGVGYDLSFDLELIEKYGLEVHAFDPTPKSIQWVNNQKLPERLHFHPWGLAAYDGEATFIAPDREEFISHTMLDSNNKIANDKSRSVSVPVFTIKSIMKKLEHQKVSLIKMDIEGAEYDVLDDFIESNIQTEQLLIEFHHDMFDGITMEETKKRVDALSSLNYVLSKISLFGREYLFIKS